MHLRDEISDAVIELTFATFPGLTPEEFRAFVHRVLRIVDYTVAEVLKEERERRYHRTYLRAKN